MGKAKSIHISQVPPRLIEVRDRWRHFWAWIPIAGSIYHWYYVRLWNKWSEQQDPDIISIDHSERRE